MEVSKGYKQTEVGVIPEDWKVLPFDELYDFQGGSQPPRHTFIFEEKSGYVRLLQIRDYKSDKYASYIPIHLAKRSCITTDIMIGRYGPPIFQILNGMEGSYNVALMKAVPSTKIIQMYGWYLLKQDKLFEFVEKLSQRSSGQTGVDLSELRKYLIPVPPSKTEQTAIATALSDADALIISIEKLIEKKRAIKQGAMQELLKPKEGWEVKKMGDYSKITSGESPSKFNFLSSGTPYFKVEQLNNCEKYQIETPYYVETVNVIPKGSIIFPKRGASILLNKVRILKDDSYMDTNLMTLTLAEELSSEFVYYTLIHIELWRIADTTSIPQINNKHINPIEISFPPIEEQTRIANILSDMDAETTALEQKLGKYKLIKQGMMQELLTGRIRII